MLYGADISGRSPKTGRALNGTGVSISTQYSEPIESRTLMRQKVRALSPATNIAAFCIFSSYADPHSPSFLARPQMAIRKGWQAGVKAV
jgi:hypothetical protein